MNASYFIAKRLGFKRKLASIAIGLSFFIIIISIAISSGFRNEIRNGIGDIAGDIQILPSNLNILDETNPIKREPSYIEELERHKAIKEITPVAYRAGIIKKDESIHGVLFKGVPSSDSTALGVAIPKKLANILNLEIGDNFISYFVGNRLRLRKFKITSIYDGLIEFDDKLIVYANLKEIQRINGWASDQISALELNIDSRYKDPEKLNDLSQEIGFLTSSFENKEDDSVIVRSSVSEYHQIFDWLNLIDFNVVFILLLMTIVAGFNMISGLLILLFENIATIGLLKSLGMKNKEIAKIFLTTSSFLVLRGMIIGNILAFILCFIQAPIIYTYKPEHR